MTAPCGITRGELSRHLEASGYGANPDIFNAYFLPKSSPPTCAACHQLIANHSDGAAATPQVVVAMAAAPAPTVPVTLPIVRNHPSPGLDVAEWPLPKAFLVIAGIFLVFMCAMLIGMGSSGLYTRAPVTVLPACVMLLIVLLLALLGRSRRIVFDRNVRRMTMTDTRLMCFCCPTVQEVDFSRIGDCSQVVTGTGKHGVPFSEVRLAVSGHPDGYIDLQSLHGFDVTSGAVAWNAYLQELRGGDAGMMVPMGAPVVVGSPPVVAWG